MTRQYAEIVPPVTQNPGPWPGVADASRTAVPLAPLRSKLARNGSIRCTLAVSVTRIPVQPLTGVPFGAMLEILGIRNVVPHGFRPGSDSVPTEDSGVSDGETA